LTDQAEFTVARIVVDTNVLLDWLLFADPRGVPLAEAIASGRCLWLATPDMLEELSRVLDYFALARWPADRAALRAKARAAATLCKIPAFAAPHRCVDADDQKFLDLACAEKADRLLTKDRHLIRAARKCGLQVAPAFTDVLFLDLQDAKP
jgi:uncharacterized protein